LNHRKSNKELRFGSDIGYWCAPGLVRRGVPYVANHLLFYCLTIQFGVFLDHAVDGEVVEHFLSGGGSEAAAFLGIGCEAVDLSGEDDAFPDGKDDARFIVSDEFAVGGDIRGEDGEAGSHGFHEAIGLAFEIAGEGEGVEAGEQFTGIVSMAEEGDSFLKAEVVGEFAEFISQGTISSDDEVGIVAGAFEEFGGPDEVFDALLRGEASDKSEDEGIGVIVGPLAAEVFAIGMRRWGSGVEGEAIADDAEARIVVAELAVEIDDGLRVADEEFRAIDEFAVEPKLPAGFP